MKVSPFVIWIEQNDWTTTIQKNVPISFGMTLTNTSSSDSDNSLFCPHLSNRLHVFLSHPISPLSNVIHFREPKDNYLFTHRWWKVHSLFMAQVWLNDACKREQWRVFYSVSFSCGQTHHNVFPWSKEITVRHHPPVLSVMQRIYLLFIGCLI